MEHCKGAICTAQATIKIIIVIRLRVVRMIRMHKLAMAIMMSIEIENDVKHKNNHNDIDNDAAHAETGESGAHLEHSDE